MTLELKSSETQAGSANGSQDWLASRQAAIGCGLIVLLLLGIAHPVAEIGIWDDWSYVLSAFKLSETGHIVYNGWATAMLGWQLYVGALFAKILGHSYTAVRLGTMAVAALNAFLYHRCLVRGGVGGQLAVLGTLCIALTPMCMLLSATYMSDTYGSFAIIICLYGCIRALSSKLDRERLRWVLFALATNLFFGTARQIAWFGAIAFVPMTIFMLRRSRNMLTAGIPCLGLAAACIMGFMHWFKQQLYSIPEPIVPLHFSLIHVAKEISIFIMEIPFLLLPLTLCAGVAFFRSNRRQSGYAVLIAALYTSVGVLLQLHHHDHVLEPTMNDTEYMLGLFWASVLGYPPIIFPLWLRAIFTFASIYGAVAAVVLIYRMWASKPRQPMIDERSLSWTRSVWLCMPFIVGYVMMLIPRAATTLFPRYMLGLAPAIVLLVLATLNDPSVMRVPKLCWVALAAVGFWAVIIVHNEFALSRARIALVERVVHAGVPRWQITDGWEGDDAYELTQAPAINEPRLVNPSNYYKPYKTIELLCNFSVNSNSPHVHPVYGIAYYPSSCLPEAPFPHERYSRWLFHEMDTIYVVRLIPSSNEDRRP